MVSRASKLPQGTQQLLLWEPKKVEQTPLRPLQAAAPSQVTSSWSSWVSFLITHRSLFSTLDSAFSSRTIILSRHCVQKNQLNGEVSFLIFSTF